MQINTTRNGWGEFFMSLQTMFIPMENISSACTQLGQKIEQNMFENPSAVVELSAAYVHTIEQMMEEYFKKHPEITKESLATSQATYVLKMEWIKEVQRQADAQKICITPFQMVQCYLFLLEITDWYIDYFVQHMTEVSYKKELQQITRDEVFQKYDPIVQQMNISKEYLARHNHTDKQSQHIVLTYGNSIIYIPKNKSSTKLLCLGIKGCNHFLKELALRNIHTLKDLPKQLDGIYLHLTGVGPTTVKKLWNQLVHMFSSDRDVGNHLAEKNIERIIYYSGESIEFSPELARLPIQEKDFPGSVKTLRSIRDNGISTYEQLPSQLVELTELPGIGRVRVQQLFHRMKSLFPHLEKAQALEKLTNDERILYENKQFIKWFATIEQNEGNTREIKLPERYIRILRKRYQALSKKEHLTLQQLGEAEGVTRERVRQIIQRGNTVIARMWRTYVECIKEKLEVEGDYIVENNHLTHSLVDYVRIQSLEVKDIYVHEKNSMRLLSLKDEQSFNDIMDEIKSDFHEEFDVVIIDTYAYKSYCKNIANKNHLPIKFVEQLTDQWIHWLNEQEGIIKNVSKAKIVEMVMLNYPEGVAIYKEEPQLNREANRLMPGSFVNEREFTAVFSREEMNERLLLWARGVYIHRNFIQAEESWIRNIQHKATAILQEKEFIHVRKLFNVVREEAKSQHIPNEYALFSLMRLYDEHILSLERFPMIQIAGDKRVNNEQRVIEYIEKKGMFATKQDFIQDFVCKRGWKSFTIEQIISDSLEIIPYEHGVYTLFHPYEWITEEQLSPFFNMINKMFEDHIVISVNTLFQCTKEKAKELKIETPHVLYALLKNVDQAHAIFERFPYILPGDASFGSMNNRALIEEFIAEKETTVTRQETIQWLSTITEASESVLDFALNTSQDILYYERGQYGEYVHRDTIGLSGKKEKQLLAEIDRVYDVWKRTAGKKYILLKDLYRSMKLPRLNNNIQWTPVLLANVIKLSGEWQTFGSYDEIYMPTHEGSGCDIEFIEHLIETEFNGVLTLSSLRLYLSEIRYSSTGEFRSYVQKAIQNGDTPFLLKNDFIIHKSQLNEFQSIVKGV